MMYVHVLQDVRTPAPLLPMNFHLKVTWQSNGLQFAFNWSLKYLFFLYFCSSWDSGPERNEHWGSDSSWCHLKVAPLACESFTIGIESSKFTSSFQIRFSYDRVVGVEAPAWNCEATNLYVHLLLFHCCCVSLWIQGLHGHLCHNTCARVKRQLTL